ncbi:E3 ubiquitin-protein ligase TRIM33 isoform X4 [Bombyx mandarina]|uniref:E3 ubiquitin-protein ligase TRIM33 n=2 Tax=Bombyx TaxID=7090 RepID=A0A8R2QX15_BOMMO|nr:E3 ubiquitin-protein ligase TRIM33 isoform X4 [Bombyx mandarina]XP_037871154.1 E3 ubiquitin-protein ligase TRIM33 isoform X3 [Bombyx mori]
MENVNFQPSGEDIERALMDLGPLLGVTIKEEVPDDLAEPSAQPPSQLAVGSLPDAPVAGGSSVAEGEAVESNDKGSADSLASPTTGRAPLSSLRCVLCYNSLASLTGTPKLMECLHSICETCLKIKIEMIKSANSTEFLGAERVTILCPICRFECQQANMIDQRFFIEKMALEQVGNNGAISGDQQCNSCEDTEPATSYCVDCAEFICDNCVLAHQRLKITKDHTIKSKEEAVAELQAAQGSARNAHDMYCTEHVQERLSLFCETCDRLTCRDCQLQHHRDHKYQFSTEMAAQARSSISSLLSEVSYKRVLLGSAMKVIRDRHALIADKKRALVHDITQTVVKLTNAINTRGKQLVLRLNEVCDAKQRTLTEKKEALEQLAAITDHCVKFVTAALEQGSDTALLYSKHSVCAHLQRIKSRRADIPNPEIPVRINLALDKLPELIRVLSTIGAIVVDGKVDGGCGGSPAATSPYPAPAPAAAPAPVPAPAPNNSAVVALQQVAMHQSYVASVAGAGYMSLAGGRARPHTPLRHPHVTSTTHPHHLHGMSELNLRGLLNAAGRGRAPHPAVHHAYQQMMNAYGGTGYNSAPNPGQGFNASPAAAPGYSGGAPGGATGGLVGGHAGPTGGRRSVGPRTPSPAPHYPPAKWHIPQHNSHNGECGPELAAGGGAPPSGGSEYKITLSRPRPQPAVVTSTNPKTPSPSLNGGASELDAVCAESVQDLMATIAKLDSNGVQVLPEHSPAPLVHSSTDPDPAPGKSLATNAAGAAGTSGSGGGGGSGDPNEDWCAVCMDGGELMCCDKCPKVFHQYCHIPTIEKLPDETESWQCLLCVNFAEVGEDAAPGGSGAGPGLGPRMQRLVERITLELYCQYELSLHFREPVPAENLHYHSKIARPMCLDAIRMKLQPGSASRYAHVERFLADVRLLFRNAYAYNPPDSQVYKDAKRLEEFFDAQLLKWLPEYAYWNGEAEGEAPTKRPRLD